MDISRILGLDYGERRLGFAISDPTGEIALPLSVDEVDSDENALSVVVSKCAETDAALLVLGLPINMDGTRGFMAQKVLTFVEKLGTVLKIPVVTFDERLSTKTAERVLIDGDMSRKKRKGLRDKLAAQIFLQSYMDTAHRKARENDALQDGDIL